MHGPAHRRRSPPARAVTTCRGGRPLPCAHEPHTSPSSPAPRAAWAWPWRSSCCDPATTCCASRATQRRPGRRPTAGARAAPVGAGPGHGRGRRGACADWLAAAARGRFAAVTLINNAGVIPRIAPLAAHRRRPGPGAARRAGGADDAHRRVPAGHDRLDGRARYSTSPRAWAGAPWPRRRATARPRPAAALACSRCPFQPRRAALALEGIACTARAASSKRTGRTGRPQGLSPHERESETCGARGAYSSRRAGTSWSPAAVAAPASAMMRNRCSVPWRWRIACSKVCNGSRRVPCCCGDRRLAGALARAER